MGFNETRKHLLFQLNSRYIYGRYVSRIRKLRSSFARSRYGAGDRVLSTSTKLADFPCLSTLASSARHCCFHSVHYGHDISTEVQRLLCEPSRLHDDGHERGASPPRPLSTCDEPSQLTVRLLGSGARRYSGYGSTDPHCFSSATTAAAERPRGEY